MFKRSYEDGIERSRLTLKEEGASKSGITPMLYSVCFLCVFGSSLVHGYSTGVLNAPEFTIQDFYNKTFTERYNKLISISLLNFLWAFTVSVYLAGGMVGIFLAGYFANRFGRRGALQFSHIFAVLAAVFFGISRPLKVFELLIIGRFIIGFSAGIGSGVVPMYLTESAAKHIRGSLGVLHQLGLTIGILLSQILGLEEILGGVDLWPVLLIFTAFPGFIVSFLLPFVSESPRFLLIVKKDEKRATEALKAFRGEDHDVKDDLQEMREEQRQLQDEPPWTMKQLFKAKNFVFRFCFFVPCRSDSNFLVFYYSTGIFKEAGIPDDYLRYATLGTGVINVAMTIITVYLMEKCGRRPLLLYGMIGMGISAGIITICLNVKHVAPGLSYLSFICTLTFVVSFAIGLGPIPLFLGGELFKQGPRPAAMSFSGMLNWLANFLVGLSFPFILSGFKAFTFIPFLVVVVIGAIITFKYVKETKNKTYEEIAQIYYGNDEHKSLENGEVELKD